MKDKSEPYKKIIALLPELSGAERLGVKQALQALEALSRASGSPPIAIEGRAARGAPTRAESLSDELLEAIRVTLASLGVEMTSLKMMKRSSSYSSFCEKVAEMEEWIKKTSSNKIGRQAFFSVAVRLLYDDLRDNGVPSRWDEDQKRLIRVPLAVGSRELMIYIYRLPTVVDKNFPSYTRAGILNMIIRRHRGPRNGE